MVRSTPAKAFGLILREYRQAADMSQQKLSDKSGLDRKFIWQIEKGRTQPSLESIFKLADALGAEIAELIARTASLVKAVPPGVQRRAAPRVESIPLGEDTCPRCKATYTLHARRLPSRQRRKFKCGFCDREIVSWSGTTSFIYRVLHPPKNWSSK